MLSVRTNWSIAICVTLAVGAALAWQHRHTQALQIKIQQVQTETGLPSRDATVVPAISTSELQRLRDDRLALERLRKEIEDLKQSAAKRPAAPPPENKPSPRVPASAWKHAGRTSPQDAIITLLWAGKNRNLEVMSSALTFDSDEARARAREMLATLPTGTREFLGTPERLMAQLIAQTLDFDAIQFLGEPQAQENPNAPAAKERGGAKPVVLQAAIHHANKAPSRMALSLQPAMDGWKLLLPEDAVDAYATRLRDGALKLP